MRRPTISGMLAALALAFAALVAAFGLYSFPLAGVPVGTDSAVFSYVGEVVAEGGMPYVDVFDHKGPLVYLVNALGSLGPSTWLLWAIEACVLGATAVLCHALGRAAGAPRGIAAIVSAAVAFLVVSRAEGGNMTEQYCLPFMAAAMLASVRAMREGALPHVLAAAMGACVAAVFLLRFTALAGLVAFCAWALAVVWRRAGAGSALVLVGWFALGALAVSAPVVAWLAAGGALGAFAQQYFAFNLLYAGSVSGADRLDALAFFAADPALLLALAASGAALVTLWRSRFDAGEGNVSVSVVNLVGLVSLFALAVASGRSYGHYSVLFAPGIALAVSGAAVQLERRGAPGWALKAGTAVAALALVVVPSAYETYERAAWHKTFQDGRAHVAQTVSGAAGGREVLVVGNECWVYLDSGARAPKPYAYRSDAMAEEYGTWLGGLLRDPASAPPVIVVASYVPAGELESAGIAERYREIARIGAYTVWCIKRDSPF